MFVLRGDKNGKFLLGNKNHRSVKSQLARPTHSARCRHVTKVTDIASDCCITGRCQDNHLGHQKNIEKQVMRTAFT